MLEVAKIKISNNLQGVFNLTLEGEYASYFEVQGTTLVMTKPIEDIGTYSVTVAVEDPLGRFDTLRADYVFNIGCCPAFTTTTTPAPVSAPTAPAPAPAPLPTGPSDISTSRVIGIMEGLGTVRRWADRENTNRNYSYSSSDNYKVQSGGINNLSLKNYDSIFRYPDGTIFTGRDGAVTQAIGGRGIHFSQITQPRALSGQEPNRISDYPGLFNGMRFTMPSDFIKALGNFRVDDNDSDGGFLYPTEIPLNDGLGIYGYNLNWICDPIRYSFGNNSAEVSGPEIFEIAKGENTTIADYAYDAIATSYIRRGDKKLFSAYSRVHYITDYEEERKWANWGGPDPDRFPSQRNYMNRKRDVNRIIEKFGSIYGFNNITANNNLYRDGALYSDNWSYYNKGIGFNVQNYNELFHIVAVLFEMPQTIHDQQERSRSGSSQQILPSLTVRNQRYNSSDAARTKRVSNITGLPIITQYTRLPTTKTYAAPSEFQQLASPGNRVYIAYYRIDDWFGTDSASEFYPNLTGPVSNRPQEEQNIVLEARLLDGRSSVINEVSAESFVYSDLCGATGYNRVDTGTVPVGTTTTTEAPVAEVPEEEEEEEEEINVEVFKMGSPNIEN